MIHFFLAVLFLYFLQLLKHFLISFLFNFNIIKHPINKAIYYVNSIMSIIPYFLFYHLQLQVFSFLFLLFLQSLCFLSTNYDCGCVVVNCLVDDFVLPFAPFPLFMGLCFFLCLRSHSVFPFP